MSFRSHLTFGSLLLLAFSAGSLVHAASVAGKWSGTVEVHDSSSGTDISVPLNVQFAEAQSGEVTGSIGREGESSVPLRNGKLEGNTLTFEAASEETSGPVKFRLTVAGDVITGEMRGAIEVEPIAGNVKLTRSK